MYPAGKEDFVGQLKASAGTAPSVSSRAQPVYLCPAWPLRNISKLACLDASTGLAPGLAPRKALEGAAAPSSIL